ncbi:MAG TPA: hypothetical protein VLI43_05230, partial [Gemmatimonadaceae bacterium]|nr:hypothetical protein [Gemmatimonadaceae bacterium]
MFAATGCGEHGQRHGQRHGQQQRTATDRKESRLTVWHKALQAMGALLLLQTSVKIPEPRGYIND